MLKTNKKSIILLAVSICLLLILIVAIGLLFNRIKIESASIKSAETAIAILEDKEKDLTNAKNSLEALKKDIEKIYKSFLTEESFVDFLKLLENMAGKSGAIFQAEKADLPSSSGGRAELSFVVRGSFASIVNFVSLFDMVPYTGIIDQVSILPDNANKTKMIMRAHYVIFNFLPRQ